MIISVVSGRGGSGKTTVACGLALALLGAGRKVGPRRMVFVDCDVEMPSAARLLRPLLRRQASVDLMLPQVDETLCTHCGHCAEVCQYGAIGVVNEQVLIFPSLCRGCGSCGLECPDNAIAEIPHAIGMVDEGRVGSMHFLQAKMKVGAALISHVIRDVKEHALGADEDALTIIDGPTGCAAPLVEALRGSDFALLVAEPTPLGLQSLRRALMVAQKQLGLPVGVIINREGMGDDGVISFCERSDVPVLMRIPDDARIAAAERDGQPGLASIAEYREQLVALYQQIAAGVTP